MNYERELYIGRSIAQYNVRSSQLNPNKQSTESPLDGPYPKPKRRIIQNGLELKWNIRLRIQHGPRSLNSTGQRDIRGNRRIEPKM